MLRSDFGEKEVGSILCFDHRRFICTYQQNKHLDLLKLLSIRFLWRSCWTVQAWNACGSNLYSPSWLECKNNCKARNCETNTPKRQLESTTLCQNKYYAVTPEDIPNNEILNEKYFLTLHTCSWNRFYLCSLNRCPWRFPYYGYKMLI